MKGTLPIAAPFYTETAQPLRRLRLILVAEKISGAPTHDKNESPSQLDLASCFVLTDMLFPRLISALSVLAPLYFTSIAAAPFPSRVVPRAFGRKFSALFGSKSPSSSPAQVPALNNDGVQSSSTSDRPSPQDLQRQKWTSEFVKRLETELPQTGAPQCTNRGSLDLSILQDAWTVASWSQIQQLVYPM